jgi:hypothetical protein
MKIFLGSISFSVLSRWPSQLILCPSIPRNLSVSKINIPVFRDVLLCVWEIGVRVDHKYEGLLPFVTTEATHPTTRLNIPEELNFQQYRCDSLRPTSCNMFTACLKARNSECFWMLLTAHYAWLSHSVPPVASFKMLEQSTTGFRILPHPPMTAVRSRTLSGRQEAKEISSLSMPRRWGGCGTAPLILILRTRWRLVVNFTHRPL